MANDWIPHGSSFGASSVFATSPGGRQYRMLQGWGPENRWWMTPDGQQIQGNQSLINYENNLAASDNARKSLSEMISGGGSGGGAAASPNPFGATPTMNNTNRFEPGLSDAEARLKSLLDDPDSIKQTGAYKFRVKQGEEALQRQLGARGMLNSGNRLMELTKYGQDMASQEYENQFGRLGNLLTNYSGSWIGDKNANTSRYSAEAGAWNAAQSNILQAQAAADANKVRIASLLMEMGKPQSGAVRNTYQTKWNDNLGAIL